MSTSTSNNTTMNSTTSENNQQQQQETRQNLFHNLVFYISGSLLQMKQCEMNDLLIRHGATVINHSTNKNFYHVTHVLATEKTYNRQTVAVRRAKAHPHIHIVHESFVYDSVKKNQLQNEKLYQFESNTNNISEQQQQSPVISTSLSSTSSPSSSTTTTTTTIPSIPPYSASSLPIQTYNPTSGPYPPSYYTDVYSQTQNLNENNNNNPIDNNNNNMTNNNNSTTNNITSNLRTVNSVSRNTPATTTATSSSSSSSIGGTSTNGRNGSASSSSTSYASRMRPVAPEQRKQPATTDKLLVSNVIMMLQEQVQCQSSLLRQRDETIENLQRELIVRKRKRDHRSPSSSSKTGKQQQVNHHLHVHLRISNYDKDGGMKTLGGDRMEDEEEWRVAHEFNSDSDDDDVFTTDDDDDNDGDDNDDEKDEKDGVTCSPNKLPRLITQLDDELVSTFFCSHRIDDLYDWQVHDSSKDIHYKMVTCNRARIQPISNICYEDEMQVSALALICKMEQSLAHPTIRNSTLPVWYPFMIVARSELISQKHMSLKNFVCTEKRILRLMQISLGVQDIWSPQFKRIDDHECLFLEDNANSSDELHKKERQLLIKGGNELKRKCSILFEITFPCDYVRFPHFIGGVLEEDQHIIVGAFCTKYAAPQNTN